MRKFYPALAFVPVRELFPQKQRSRLAYSSAMKIRRHLPLLAPLLAVTGLFQSLPAQALDMGRPVSRNLLVSAGEWAKLCRSNGVEPGTCLIQLTRPMAKAGRGGDEFIVPMPPAPTILTRSGVLLSPAINKRIEQVLQDSANMTTVELRSGEQCKVFSAHGELHRSHQDPQAYTSLMRFITDDPSARISSLEPSQIAQKTAYRFTQPDINLLGAYVVDKKQNAGVWAVCQTAGDTMPGPGAQAFLGAIIGSARRY
jgi:hypothetical protein